MAIEYDIDQENSIVYVRVYDAIGISDIEDVFLKVQQDPLCIEGIDALIDAREMRSAFFIREMDSLLKFLASPAAGFVGRYAFVVAGNLILNVGRSFHFRAHRAGLKMGAFRDYASALKWFRKSRKKNT